ncbi:hypothetical protein BH09SUM1_BH09SUM1_04420 [soil metagenome]
MNIRLLVTLLLSLVIAPIVCFAQPVADFELPAVGAGKAFKLSEHRGRVVALHFLLKTECPFCIKFTKEYSAKAAEFAGVDQVFIKPDTEDEIKAWATKVENPGLPVYRDADAKLADTLGVPNGYAFHKQTVHFPAVILIDREGNAAFRYVGKANTDRLPFAKFTEEVKKLQSNPRVQSTTDATGVAAAGYDVVSYQADSTATAGDPAIKSVFGSGEYHFASAEHRALFNEFPQRYIPVYGGWCATAMARGETIAADPKNFKVVTGHTVLLCGDAAEWNKDEANLIKQATEHWRAMTTQTAAVAKTPEAVTVPTGK